VNLALQLAWVGVDDAGQASLYVHDIETGQTKMTATWKQASGANWQAADLIRWSPDGSRLLISKGDNQNRSLAIVHLDRGTMQTLFKIPEYAWVQDAQWSPDGEWIAFQESDEMKYSSFTTLWLINRRGKTPVKLTQQAYGLRWSPDSKRLFFFNGKAWSYNPATGGMNALPPPRYWLQPGVGYRMELLNSDAILTKRSCCEYIPGLDSYFLKGMIASPEDVETPPPKVGLFQLPSDGSAGRLLFTMEDYPEFLEEASSYFFSPDGKRLAIVGTKRYLLIDLAESRVQEELEGSTFLGWSPNGESWAQTIAEPNDPPQIRLQVREAVNGQVIFDYPLELTGLSATPGSYLRVGRELEMYWSMLEPGDGE
jgi:hypothetical protein